MEGAQLVRAALERVASRQDLDQAAAAAVLAEIMAGNVSAELTAAFLIALRTKGETVDELARSMRAFASRVEVSAKPLLDTAGTGGGRSSYNVSTTAALIAAGAGLAVAKHGNRSATSQSGSADLLEALGARIELDPQAVGGLIERCRFGFMFAPVHHQATRYVAGVRRELGVRTVFNLLGPLTNPAGAGRQLIGVADPRQLQLMAGALAALGSEHALVVSGRDGLDEVSAFAPTEAIEVREGGLRELVITPEQLGLDGTGEAPPGSTPQRNAELVRAVLGGEEQGPALALALANAAAAIYVGGGAKTLGEGAGLARESVASGAALVALERYVAATREVG